MCRRSTLTNGGRHLANVRNDTVQSILERTSTGRDSARLVEEGPDSLEFMLVWGL
jgi:hypothetical protein